MDETPETDDAGRLRQVQRWYETDIRGVREWRDEAEQAYRYRDGDQWSEEDRAKLRAEMRPCITMNEIAAVVETVAGSEINAREEISLGTGAVALFTRLEADLLAGVDLRTSHRLDDSGNLVHRDARTHLGAQLRPVLFGPLVAVTIPVRLLRLVTPLANATDVRLVPALHLPQAPGVVSLGCLVHSPRRMVRARI
jgi:hypothetical protein